MDPLYGRHRRIEHWDNAIRQGKLAARNMAGAGESHCCTSYFYSTVFGITFEFFGDMSDYDETIVRGSFDKGSVAVFYMKEGVLQAAFLQGRPGGERKVVNQLISERRQLAAVQDRLADESFELEKTLAA
jgi:NTE family protein